MSVDYAVRRPVFPTAVTVLTMPEPSSSTPFQHAPQTDHDKAGILITSRWNQRSRWVGNPEHHEPEYAPTELATMRLPLTTSTPTVSRVDGWELSGTQRSSRGRQSGECWAEALRFPRRTWDPFPKSSKQDTFVRVEINEALRDPAPLLHHWLQETAGLPTGTLWHILLLSAPADFHRPVMENDDPEPIEPLRSQPLMELCLGIPTYILAQGAGDRLLVRTAFEKDLPAPVLRRLSKGFIDEGFQSVVRHNAPFVRELLLEGLLVKERILDRPKLEQCLSDGFLRGGPPRSELFAHICTEVWLRVWQAA